MVRDTANGIRIPHVYSYHRLLCCPFCDEFYLLGYDSVVAGLALVSLVEAEDYKVVPFYLLACRFKLLHRGIAPKEQSVYISIPAGNDTEFESTLRFFEAHISHLFPLK